MNKALLEQVIDVLAQLPPFRKTETAQEFIRLALYGSERGEQFIRQLNWNGSPREMARRIALEAQRYC